VVPDDGKVKVLSSSTDLFYYYKTSMRILLDLSKASSLFDLYGVYKRYLRDYASALTARIPTLPTPLAEKDEKTMCAIINTAEYCGTNTQGLGKTVKKHIGAAEAEKVDLQTEQSEFEAVIAKANKALITGLLLKVEPFFQQMTKMPWPTWSYVEDQSPYVNGILDLIRSTIPKYMDWLSTPASFSFFCDGFCLAFVASYIQYLFQCKKVSDVGAQQLMLDLAALKTMLSDIPKAGKDLPVPARYLKTVKKETGKIENLLRVVLSPTASLVENYKALIPEPTESEFAKILEFKGVTRADQKSLMDLYKGPSAKPARRNLFNLDVPLFKLDNYKRTI